MKEYRLRYNCPAPEDIEGWEKYSLPIGNGCAGTSIFGGIASEKIVFFTNVFANRRHTNDFFDLMGRGAGAVIPLHPASRPEEDRCAHRFRTNLPNF